MDAPPNTDRRALTYALRELGRRAGVAERSIAQWRVSFDRGSVTLFPQPGVDARVVFPYGASKPQRFDVLSRLKPSTYHWHPASNGAMRSGIPNFIVLFEEEPRRGEALFRRTEPQRFECQADILTCVLWTLGRFEELHASAARDEHGRFPAAASAAYRAGCLERPIVDEYGAALEDVLAALLPGWRPRQRRLRVKLSHDVDLTGLPVRLRSTLGHLYPRKIPAAFGRDVLAAAGIGRTAYMDAVVRTANISRARGLHSAFYWQAAAPTKWDAGYAVEHPQIRRAIEWLQSAGFENGIHPGYQTFGSAERLREEVSRLRGITGAAPMGGRQHYLRWSPRTWNAWEEAGLAYDSTVGYADAVGFRAGTCIPYHPWLFEQNRESKVLEIPLVVMDCTPIRYMSLSPQSALESIASLIDRCKAVGGVFTLLWHNVSVIERPYAALYPRILDLLDGASPYDWKSDSALAPSPLELASR